MIPMSDIKWFIDPIQSPHLRSNRLYVLLERYPRPSRNSMVGKVVEVKDYEHTGKHVWWTTTDGYQVYGAPVGAPNHPAYRPAVALLNEETFLVGESYTVADTTKAMVLRNFRRSDLKSVRMPGGNTIQAWNVLDYMLGAPWARAGFPELGDSAEVVRLKVEIAKAKWERRWAEAEIMREGFARGWDDDLKELNDDGHMDKPVWGAMVTASALMPIHGTVELSDHDKLTIERLTERGALRSDSIHRPMISLPVKYAVNLETQDPDVARDPGRQVLFNGLRLHLGTSAADLGDTDTTPVLTGTV